jgi:hypothetical protein
LTEVKRKHNENLFTKEEIKRFKNRDRSFEMRSNTKVFFVLEVLIKIKFFLSCSPLMKLKS